MTGPYRATGPNPDAEPAVEPGTPVVPGTDDPADPTTGQPVEPGPDQDPADEDGEE